MKKFYILPFLLFFLTVIIQSKIYARLPKFPLYGSKADRNAQSFLSENRVVGFRENKGEVNDAKGNSTPGVFFRSSYKGIDIYITSSGLTYVFTKSQSVENQEKDHFSSSKHKSREPQTVEGYRTDMRLLGATIKKENIVKEHPSEQGYSNYYLANCPQGITNVREYNKVTIKEIYPGIDWVLYADAGKMIKYDFVIHPGAEPEDIKMSYEGASGLKEQDNGSFLKIKTPLGEIQEGAVSSYEKNSGRKVNSRYKISKNVVYFETGSYDHKQEFVIDPPLQWSTYYSGSDGWDNYGYSITADKNNNVFITGTTRSATFPVTVGAFQSKLGNAMGFNDVIVVKFNASGTRLWATYYGGNNEDYGWGISTDNNGDVAITGPTSSSNFPVSPGACQTAKSGGQNAFIVKLDAAGARLWASYYGRGTEEAAGIASDNSNNFIITGYCASASFPATGGVCQTFFGGSEDAFVVKFDGSGGLKWATFYGGSSQDRGVSVATDASENIFVTGWTEFGFPVTVGAFQTSDPGDFDAFVVKLDNLGNLSWASYCGGNGYDDGSGIDADNLGNVYVTGRTYSIDFPVTAGAFQTKNGSVGGDADVFIIGFDNSGTQLWATYFGGKSYDSGLSLAVDGCGNVFVTGQTISTSFPVTSGSFQTKASIGSEAFIIQLDNSGNRQWASFYGGTNFDRGNGVATDLLGNMLVIGETQSTNFPLTAGAFQTKYVSGGDIFVSKFGPFSTPVSLTAFPSYTVCSGSSTTLSVSGTGSYIWTPSGSLSSSTGNIVTATPTIATTYIITDATSGSCPASITVKVNGLPTLLVTPSSAMCSGDPPVVIGAAGAVSYTWSPSTGLSSTTGSSVTASPSSGINTYVVTGTDAGGCMNDSSITITVNSLPTLTISSNATICIGNSAGISAAGAVSYTWLPSSGLSSATNQTVIASPSVTTTYSITGTGANGCISTANVSVSVNALPVIIINPSFISICDGSSTTLSALGTSTAPPIDYVWTPGTGLSANSGSVVTAAPLVSTTYTVVGTDGNGCYNTAVATVNVNTLLIITTTPANVSICIGDAVPIIATGAITYDWYPATALNSNTGSSVTASPTSNITYTVTGTNNNGCTGEATSNITVFTLPLITASSDVTICSGNSATLSADGAVNYIWNPATSPSTGQTVTATPNATTTYTVTGTDQNGCSNTSNVMVSVANPVTVIISPDITINLGDMTTLSASAGNGASFIWTPASSLSCNTCSNPIASPTVSTIYYVSITDNNGCQIMDSVMVAVKLNCGDDVFVPDAFSPNADGSNDVLYFKIKNGCIKTITFQIFDRWGAKAFESFDPANGWDGKLNGIEYQTAVFVYYVQATLKDDSPFNKKGNISLVR